MHLIECQNCNKKVLKYKKTTKFCNSSCANSFNNKKRKHSEETKNKIKNSLNINKENKWKNQSIIVGNSTKLKYSGKIPNSILDLSSRTKTKILKRLNLGCCICGWNESTIDLHHINGRKIENPHSHDNLTPLCPNHHRLVHNGKIEKSKLKTLNEILTENWKNFYFG